MPKKVGRANYIHRSALADLPAADRTRVQRGAIVLPGGFDWSIARIVRQAGGHEIMFGETTSFDRNPHPALKRSVLVRVGRQKAQAGKVRSYNPQNRPIYHRKEQMMSASHPRYAAFAQLTADEDRAGLLSRPDIGREASWACLLADNDWMIRGHHLVRADTQAVGSRALDLGAIVASVVAAPQQQSTLNLGAITGDVIGRPTRAPGQQKGHGRLPGRGVDPKEAWLRLLKRRRPPLDMVGWSQRRRQIAQGFVPDLRWYDVILINTSAGKDSIVTALEVFRMAQEQGVVDRIIMVHADLGLVEWEGSAELAAEHAKILGVPFEVVRKPIDFLERILAYGMWPSRSSRFCTGEYKTAEVDKLITRLTERLTDTSGGYSLSRPERQQQLKTTLRAMANLELHGRKIGRGGELSAAYRAKMERADAYRAFLDTGLRPVRFLNVLGLRAAEGGKGGDRYKKAPFLRKQDDTRRLVDTWLPVHAWSDDEVWEVVNAGRLPPPKTYACGMTRHSCMFCVMAGKSDLINAALLSPEMLDEYVKLQRTLTDPRVNPWHGDVLRMDDRTLTVLARYRPGHGTPHQIVFTTRPVNADEHSAVVAKGKVALAQFIDGFDTKTVPIEEWRTQVKGVQVVRLGRNAFLRNRYFPPMPVQQIARLTKRLQAQGVDPRQDKDAARQVIDEVVAEWKAAHKANPPQMSAWRPFDE